MNAFDPHSYTVTVKRVVEDGERLFKATVKELPHLAEFGDSHEEVYERAIDAINALRNMAEEMGHKFPSPSIDDEIFSGRVTLRMPKSLHRSATNMADREGVSLNQFLVAAIAEKVGSTSMLAWSSPVKMWPDVHTYFGATETLAFVYKTASSAVFDALGDSAKKTRIKISGTARTSDASLGTWDLKTVDTSSR